MLSVRSRFVVRGPGPLRPIAAALLAVTSRGAHATLDTWVGASGGFRDVAGYWNGGVTPGACEAVSTGSAQSMFRTETVSLAGLRGTGKLTIQRGTLKVDGLTSSIGSLTMGDAGRTLAIRPGSALAAGSPNFGSGTIGAAHNEGSTSVTGATTFDSAGACLRRSRRGKTRT